MYFSFRAYKDTSSLNAFFLYLIGQFRGEPHNEHQLPGCKGGPFPECIKDHFRDYQEGVKFQYLFKFISGYADLIHEALRDHFTAHQADLSDISEMISNHQSDRQETTRTLDELLEETKRIIDRIGILTNNLTGG